VARELRFAETFAADARAGAVLTHAAETLFALRDERAPAVAQQVLKRQPPAADEQRRVAWTVVAHSAFDGGRFGEAEQAYREVLALTPAAAPARAALDERLAAAVYKQGEAARGAGDLKGAVAHFERVAALAPGSSVQATAQYDAAAAQIALKDWAGAARTLEDFRQRHPQHPLAAELPPKLAAAYLALERWGPAAGELERVAASLADPAAARDALWQAAELHARAGDKRAAARVYERYVAQYPQPLEPAVEARDRLATLAREAGDAKAALAWTRAVQQADRDAGGARTDRTRLLGARASLALAEPVFQAYRDVRLVKPLQRQLKLKKTRLEQALQACAQVADYAVAEAVTAAAFHSAALYEDFGQALLKSERPKGLKKAEREQYDVMLEEQAFPFEEKAIELHAANARRAADGVYDAWVRRSFDALAKLQPARWAKAERGALAKSLADWEAAPPTDAAGWTALGVARREQGRFAEARSAYERALALQPGHADALLNQAILHDLYLGEGAQALPLYTQYLARQPGGDTTVARWVADLQRRFPAAVPATAVPAAPVTTAAPVAVSRAQPPKETR
jgi:outer membrane protein assembly factor BamD (BamD/ComL family)